MRLKDSNTGSSSELHGWVRGCSQSSLLIAQQFNPSTILAEAIKCESDRNVSLQTPRDIHQTHASLSTDCLQLSTLRPLCLCILHGLCHIKHQHVHGKHSYSIRRQPVLNTKFCLFEEFIMLRIAELIAELSSAIEWSGEYNLRL